MESSAHSEGDGEGGRTPVRKGTLSKDIGSHGDVGYTMQGKPPLIIIELGGLRFQSRQANPDNITRFHFYLPTGVMAKANTLGLLILLTPALVIVAHVTGTGGSLVLAIVHMHHD